MVCYKKISVERINFKENNCQVEAYDSKQFESKFFLEIG